MMSPCPKAPVNCASCISEGLSDMVASHTIAYDFPYWFLLPMHRNF